MDTVLAQVLGSMHADIARLERVATNLANVQTPGYKREVLAARPFAEQVANGVAATSVHTDQRPGTLKATGQALDFAVAGPGWFEVTTPRGPAYTRQGQFRLDAGGRLVTQQGYPVMGVSGEIVVPDGNPTVDSEGRLFAAAGTGRPGAPALAQFRIARFEAGVALQRLGEGLVLPQGAPVQTTPNDGIQVRQGHLENSNVSQMHEMVRLLETVRHLETLQKVALGYDEMLSTSIRKLGEAQ